MSSIVCVIAKRICSSAMRMSRPRSRWWRRDSRFGLSDLIPDPDAGPSDELATKEEFARLEEFKEQFLAFLGKERLLKEVFAFHWAGERKPKTIARALKVTVRTVQDIDRRLERKVAEFFFVKSSGKIKI